MEFRAFKKEMQDHVKSMLSNKNNLFEVDLDKDKLYAIYLDSFPEGTNKVFRERREYDCSCCRQLIKNFGNAVVVENNKITTIWDFDAKSTTFQPVIDALAAFIKSHPITDVFLTKESGFGTDKNIEDIEGGGTVEWHHYRIDLPSRFVTRSSESIDSLKSDLRAVKHVFSRSLNEISPDALDTILDLISQNSLYKGEEWKGALKKFKELQQEYLRLPEDQKDIYCWVKSIEVGASIGKIKNHSIGVLLMDVTEGMDLNDAVKRYEKIVAPTNYKRPKAIFTQKMVDEAKKKIEELGLIDSLDRRYASLEDITINNILFANRDVKKALAGDVFSDLKKSSTKKQNFDKLEELPIETFIKDVLPTASSLEVFLENKHSGNLMSLIAPKNKDSRSMFKWNNNFSWAYNGNITDSMKDNVKAHGGNVDGVLRFSIQWNDNNDNNNDLDAHCIEPDMNIIYFPNKGHRHPSSGMLDVDIVNPGGKVAVENIIYTDLSKMKEGTYEFSVHTFSYRGGKGGFSAEIEFNGQIFSFDHKKDTRYGEKVVVAKVNYSKKDGLKIVQSMPSSMSSRKVWEVDTQQFVPVSVVMNSPNYWDLQTGIGNKHYFFMINGCKNDTKPNGFFNEFLREDLMEHRRVFEALGSKMSVEDSTDQLSGLGFSSTKRDSLICKVEGNFTRTIKVIF